MEALALLLNIPASKTLLRRHLATHFHLLVGAEAQRLKQECLENPDYTVLTATAKVKVTEREKMLLSDKSCIFITIPPWDTLIETKLSVIFFS